jgi:hypothetical protein
MRHFLRGVQDNRAENTLIKLTERNKHKGMVNHHAFTIQIKGSLSFSWTKHDVNHHVIQHLSSYVFITEAFIQGDVIRILCVQTNSDGSGIFINDVMNGIQHFSANFHTLKFWDYPKAREIIVLFFGTVASCQSHVGIDRVKCFESASRYKGDKRSQVAL